MTKKTPIKEKPKPGDRIDSRFGVATVLKYFNGKIQVRLPGDTTATFREAEFFEDFAC